MVSETTPLLLDDRANPIHLFESEDKVSHCNCQSSQIYGLQSYPIESKHFISLPDLQYKLRFHEIPETANQQVSSFTYSSERSQPLSYKTISFSPRLSQALCSLPYRLLCIASTLVPSITHLCCCFTRINSSEYGILERFGEFNKILEPGMHTLKWPIERVAGKVNVRVRQLDLCCETKSRDNVFLGVHVSIQYQADSHQLFQSFYSLQSLNGRLTALTMNTLRSKVPQMELDDIFNSHDDIASELQNALNGNMNQYGFTINHALLTRIEPNEKVRQSMNAVQANKCIKEAMSDIGIANKVEIVTDAEAKAEKAYLNGASIAKERRAIASGLKNIVMDAQSSSETPVSTKGVMDLLVLSQYLDTIVSLNGSNDSSGTSEDVVTLQDQQDQNPSSSLILAHMPETVLQFRDMTRDCFSCHMNAVQVANLLDL